MTTPRIRIWIEPALSNKFGPSVEWAWRSALTSLGMVWEQVTAPGETDIAYVTAGTGFCPPCKIKIVADTALWSDPAALGFQGVERQAEWHLPVYSLPTATAHTSTSSDGATVLSRDVIFDFFWLVTGQSEQHAPRNAHGQLDLTDSISTARPMFEGAMASALILTLGKLCQALVPTPAIPRWPNGARLAASASHDVDYPNVIRWLEPLRILKRRGRKHLGEAWSVLAGTRTHWHFESWIKAESKLGYRSAFYFVPRQGSLLQYALGTPDPFYDITSSRFLRLFQTLQAEGFEVGIHASYDSYASPATFAAEKAKLERISGQVVDGCRHHYWHLDPAHPEATLALHHKLGLKYDCSLAHQRYVGWRRGLSWPFFPFSTQEHREIPTLQIPTGWMDDQLFGHKEDNPGESGAILSALVDTVQRQHGVFLVDIHDYVFDDTLYPGWASTYFDVFSRLSERSDVWLATPRDIASHWRARYEKLVQLSRGLRAGLACGS